MSSVYTQLSTPQHQCDGIGILQQLDVHFPNMILYRVCPGKYMAVTWVVFFCHTVVRRETFEGSTFANP